MVVFSHYQLLSRAVVVRPGGGSEGGIRPAVRNVMTVTSLVKHHRIHHHHPMAVNRETTVRKIISMPRALEAQVRAFRHRHEISTEAEAIRRLVEIGLSGDSGSKGGTEQNSEKTRID